MAQNKASGVYQMKDGTWGYRFSIIVEGKTISRKKTTDEFGNKLKTKKQAIKARENAMVEARIERERQHKISRRTVEEVYSEYCEKGRSDRAYMTIRKQDCLWRNHIKERFGKRYIDEISVAEINDYLAELYHKDGYAYRYTESFLKMFYLIFGQAYSRDYLDVDSYNSHNSIQLFLMSCKAAKIKGVFLGSAIKGPYRIQHLLKRCFALYHDQLSVGILSKHILSRSVGDLIGAMVTGSILSGFHFLILSCEGVVFVSLISYVYIAAGRGDLSVTLTAHFVLYSGQ